MHKVLFNRYEIINPLGKGAQSTVYLVRDNFNHAALKAAKVLKAEVFKQNSGSELIQEFQLLESIDHDNLVRVLECRLMSEDKVPVVISEYFENSSNLESYLVAQTLTFEDKIQIAYQALSAINYLHQKKILHGDIKPSNVLISGKSEITSYPVVKLIDFGVSQDLFLAGKKKRVGTPYYIAPEVVNEGIGFASDIYSFGVILFRMFINNELPYKGIKRAELLASHAAGRPLLKQSHFENTKLPELLNELIQSCLKHDPLERPRKINEWLQRLRFEFSSTLSLLPIPSRQNNRSRRCYGFDDQIATALDTIQNSQINTFIACAASGGGKTRFVHEVAKQLQKQGIHFQIEQFSKTHFWKKTFERLLSNYSSTATVKKLRGRILQSLDKQSDDAIWTLGEKLLIGLAQEFQGFVLLIDGLPAYLPQSFFEMFEAFVNRSLIKTGARKAKLSFVISSDISRVDSSDLTGDESLDLDGLLPDSKHESADYQIPAQIRFFSAKGNIKVQRLPIWTPKEMRAYFEEILGPSTGKITSDSLEEILLHTGGNPGIIQSLFSSGDFSPENISKQLSSAGEIHDLHVYKLQYLDDRQKSVLAFISSQDEVSFKDTEATFPQLSNVRDLFVRAFDDGLIEMTDDSAGMYFVNNENLKTHLRKLALDKSTQIHIFLNKLLDQSEALTNVQRLYLARFLGAIIPWSTALRSLFSQDYSPQILLKYANFVIDLRLALKSRKHSISDEDRLWIDYYAAEVSNLQSNLKDAENIILSLIKELEESGLPSNEALLAKSYLTAGSTYRAKLDYPKASSYLEKVVASDLLMDRDHYYALGSLAYCNLLSNKETSAERKEDRRENIEIISQMCRELKSLDPVRCGILTENIGSYYFWREQSYKKALLYYERALTIFDSVGDSRRKTHVLKSIGITDYRLARYDEAIKFLSLALPNAERLHLNQDCLEIYCYLIYAKFSAGDEKDFVSLCSRFNDYCTSIGDWTRMPRVTQPIVHAYLEKGLIMRAQSFVQQQMERLAPNQDLDSQFFLAICQGLLVRISQLSGRWTEALEHFQKAETSVKKLEGKHPNADTLSQVLLLFHADQLEHDSGARIAAMELEKHINENRFSEYLQPEAVFRHVHNLYLAGDEKNLEGVLGKANELINKIYPDRRLIFHTDALKFHLDRKDLNSASEVLKKARKLWGSVHNPLLRAQLLHQEARYLMWTGEVDKAFERWSLSDKEFDLYTETWNQDFKETFRLNTPEWQEHIKIREMLGLTAGTQSVSNHNLRV